MLLAPTLDSRLLLLITLLTPRIRHTASAASLTAATSTGSSNSNSGGDPLSEWLGRVQVNLPNQTLGGKPGSSGYTVNLYDLACSPSPAILPFLFALFPVARPQARRSHDLRVPRSRRACWSHHGSACASALSDGTCRGGVGRFRPMHRQVDRAAE